MILVSALARGAPSWWRGIEPDAYARAVAVEDGFVSQLAAMREPADGEPGASWSFSLQAADATAWVNERLPRWVANHEAGFRWPEAVREVQVEFDEGVVKLGARLRAGSDEHAVRAEEDRYYSVVLRPWVDADGRLWLRPGGAAVGAMPVPPGAANAIAMAWIRGAAVDLFASEGDGLSLERVSEQVSDAAAGRRPLVQDAIIRIDPARHVRILAIVPRRGRLEVTARTEFTSQRPD